MKNNYSDKLAQHIKAEVLQSIESPDTRCLKCGVPVATSDYICSNCIKELTVHKHRHCLMCGRISKKLICEYCLEFDKPFKKIFYVFQYDGFAKDAFIRYKENGNMLYGKFLTKAIVDRFPLLEIPPVDIVTNVPSHFIRPILRMCNPPQKFAKAISKEYNIPYKSCLQRKTNKHANRKSNRMTRMQVAMDNFTAENIDIKGKNILLIDDVITTGATTHICSQELKRIGAENIYILSLCCVLSK